MAPNPIEHRFFYTLACRANRIHDRTVRKRSRSPTLFPMFIRLVFQCLASHVLIARPVATSSIMSVHFEHLHDPSCEGGGGADLRFCEGFKDCLTVRQTPRKPHITQGFCNAAVNPTRNPSRKRMTGQVGKERVALLILQCS